MKSEPSGAAICIDDGSGIWMKHQRPEMKRYWSVWMEKPKKNIIQHSHRQRMDARRLSEKYIRKKYYRYVLLLLLAR